MARSEWGARERTSRVPTEKMLVSGKKLRVDRLRIRGIGVNGESGIDIEGHRRQTEFLATGLVAEFEREVLCAERGTGEHGDWEAQDYFVLIDVEGCFAESEGVQLAFGVGRLAEVEARGRSCNEIGGDKVV